MIFPRLIPIILMLVVTGCGYKPRSQGEYSEVAVFADRELRPAISKTLSQLLEIPIDTPQPEQLFYLRWPEWDDFSQYTERRNIILLGTLKGDGAVSNYVRGMLSSDALEGVRQGDYWYFAKDDAWARGQSLYLIVADDIRQLANRIKSDGESIYHTMRESVLQRLKSQLYASAERRKLADEIFDKYGFKLRIQHDYTIVLDSPEERLLRLRRFFPDRWLTVSWVEGESLSQELVERERNRINKIFNDPVYTYPEYNRFSPNDEIVSGGILLRGIWATESTTGGGPFFTYALPDMSQGRIYFIDGAVFAPDREKVPLLLQLEVMAQTFELPEPSREVAFE